MWTTSTRGSLRSRRCMRCATDPPPQCSHVFHTLARCLNHAPISPCTVQDRSAQAWGEKSERFHHNQLLFRGLAFPHNGSSCWAAHVLLYLDSAVRTCCCKGSRLRCVCCSTTEERVWQSTQVKVTSQANPKARVTGSRVVAAQGATSLPVTDAWAEEDVVLLLFLFSYVAKVFRCVIHQVVMHVGQLKCYDLGYPDGNFRNTRSDVVVCTAPHLGVHNLLLQCVCERAKQLVRVMLQARLKLRRCCTQGTPQGSWVQWPRAARSMVQHACQERVCEAVRGERWEGLTRVAQRVAKLGAVEEGLQDAVEVAGVAQVGDAGWEGWCRGCVEAGALGHRGGGAPQRGTLAVQW